MARWICAQIGAREHYAVPRMLHRHGRLAGLFTDYWAGVGVRVVAKMVDGDRKMAGINSLAGRFHRELADTQNGKQKAEIASWNWRALWWEMVVRKKLKAESGKQKCPYAGFVEVGRRFSVRVREALRKRSDLQTSTIVFAYDTGALELFAWCRERGIKTVLGVMDPGRAETELVHAEERRWPAWVASSSSVPEEYIQRREREWALADRVVVNSEFSRRALLKQGVPAEKLVVIPLCYEENAEKLKAESRNQRSEIRKQKAENRNGEAGCSSANPLRVLFLGQVILRKGIQYLVEAAKLLKDEPIRFEVVGPVGIGEEVVKSAPANVVFHGRVPRDSAAEWYQKADVFVLPTVSDGFALTQLEAMAYGLPVVATPNCGDVVADGVDGFLVPVGDAKALAGVFQRYLNEPNLLEAHQRAARKKSGQYGIDQIAKHWLKLEASLLRN